MRSYRIDPNRFQPGDIVWFKNLLPNMDWESQYVTVIKFQEEYNTWKVLLSISGVAIDALDNELQSIITIDFSQGI